MGTGTSERGPVRDCDLVPSKWKFTAAWRQAVQRRRTMLVGELDSIDRSHWTNSERTQSAHLLCLLADANAATQQRVGPLKWWWGTEIERAWARLREVEERIPALLPDAALLRRVDDALAHADVYLPASDRRVTHLNELRQAARDATPRWKTPLRQRSTAVRAAELRSSIVDVLRASHRQADQANQEARHLRNRLILASAASVTFLALVVVAQAWLPEVRFISVPPDLAPITPWKFALLIMLFGAIGALFTAIPAMSEVPSDKSPFNLPLQQAFLKIAFGPLVAFIGSAVVRSDFVNTSPSSWPGLLAIVTALGAGQQAVTKYVDNRAEKILAASHSG
ncbi:hypothetical protein ACFYTQ_26640 [Nocardia sp. NPDC004068]|uniref:hypothetical protein n=1 Tax=Nocardia sp. NPDC004068 TaxID=3364303 RepID=UPI0036AD703F